MSKKTIIIIIGIIAIISAVGGYVYMTMSKPNQAGDTTSTMGKIFSPFGFGQKINQGVQNSNGVDISIPKSDIPTTPIFGSKFNQITDFAVSGATFFIDQRPLTSKPVEVKIETPTNTNKITGTKKTKVTAAPPTPTTEPVPSIRYMKRNDGHIYEKYLDTGATGQISNSTIPEVYEGLFSSNPNNVIYRLLGQDDKTIKTAYGVLGGRDSGFLPDNTLDLSISPNGNNIFYLATNSTGIYGVIGSFVDTKKSQIFASPFTEWLSQWPTNQTIFLTTKPSYGVDGFMYALSTTNSKIKKIMGGVKGLTTQVSPNGDKVLYSESTSAGPRMSIYTISTGKYSETGLYTLPEKCVWMNDSITIYCAVPDTIESNLLPDEWYQGQISFNDKFYRINTEINSLNQIANSIENIPVDGIKLFTDDTQKTLFFTNKKDNTLWSLDLR